MATRNEREKQQRMNEKHKNILAALLAREENKYCADCLAKGPRWASWNLGVLLCIRCSGLHRSLGVHISRVKSVNLDTWTSEQMLCFCSRGNGWAKDYYEARLPKDFKRPQSDSTLEYFIRDKYERKKYISPNEITLRSIKDLGLLEDNTAESNQKTRRRDQRGKENVSIVSIPKPKGLKPTSPAIPRPKSLPQLPQHGTRDSVSPVLTHSHAHSHAANTDDLLGLNSPISTNAPVAVAVTAPAPPSADLTEDLFGPLSSYNGHLHTITSSVSSPDLLNGDQTSGPNESSPSTSTAEPPVAEKKLSKDSILSLYSQGTTSTPTQNSMMSSGNFNMPTQNSLTYQQQQPIQGFPNIQGMQGPYATQQQQAMAMQQQMQMQQMAQQMAGMNVTGMQGYPMMATQGQANPMQNSAGFNMGYGAQVQMGQQGFVPQQQMYGGMPNGNMGMGQAPAMMGGYNAAPMMGGGVPNMGGMQGQQQGANGSAWGASAVPPAGVGMNPGHTLSTQLWK